jgi:23S rRNA (uracil1939-C5)-methyltransferase
MDQVTIDLVITDIANGGDGIGRLTDGRAVFVPFTIPGETIRANVVEEKKGYVRGELIKVINPARNRIRPRCKHFGTCGGCHFQHFGYQDQLGIKTKIIEDVLLRVGGLSGVNVLPIIPSHKEWNYRNNIQYHLHACGKLGYQRHLSNEVIPIDECFLPSQILGELRTQIDLDFQTGIKRVSFREGIDEEVLILLEGENSDLPEMEINLPVSVVHISDAGNIVLAGSDFLMMQVKDKQFKVSAESFFQVNTSMSEKMVDHVISLLPKEKLNCLVDLYCGAGLFSAFTAEMTNKLIGIEFSHSACMDYAENLDEYNHIELYEGSADIILPRLEISPDVVIVDPPRAGIGRNTIDALIKLKPNRIIYVSCDPATLARDASRLEKGGYSLVQLTPFDLFPQTFHIESISVFDIQS